MTDSTLPLSPVLNVVTCVVCSEKVEPARVTAGSLYADGRQAFACNDHVRERLRWATAWLAFDAEQQRLRQAIAESASA